MDLCDDRGFFSFRGIKEVPGICVIAILEYLDSRLSGFDWIWCRILGDLESMESNFERTQRNGDDRSKTNLLFKIWWRNSVSQILEFNSSKRRNSIRPQKKLSNKAVSPWSSKHVLFWHFLNTCLRVPNMKGDVDRNEVDQLSNVVHPYYLLNLTPNNSVYSVSFIPKPPSFVPFHFHFIIIKYIYILYIVATIFL